MAHKNTIELEGTITESLPNACFRVETKEGKMVFCQTAGKLRINHIRILPGDKVRIEITPYDETRGRIIYRF